MSMNQPGAKIPEFVLADRPGFLEPIKLLQLISDTEPDDTPKLVAGLFRILGTSLRHAPCLEDQVREHAQIWDQDQDDDPERLAPAGNVMPSEQVGKDRDEQPEPEDEHEYREDVHQEVGKAEASVEQHSDLPSESSCLL